jgi:hypothetical protein
MASAAERAQGYRNKAEEVRIIAESMKTEEAKTILLSVAQDYLAMAAMLDHAAELGEALPDLPDSER